jgi:hypothetical protein
MKSLLDIGILQFDKKKLPPEIKCVLSDLSKRRDVLGAVLVRGDMGIVACDLPAYDHETPEILDELAMMENWGAYPRRVPKNSLFPQLVKDDNGFKVYAKKMSNDLTLFVMMQSSGYIGLAVPDIEKTIKKIKKALVEASQ